MPDMLPRFGWCDRSKVYHDIVRRNRVPEWGKNIYLYSSACGLPFSAEEVGNEPPVGRRLCKMCERARKESDG